MSITYQRTGGFIGKSERLTFDADFRSVTASDRGEACPPRILTTEESAQLRAWYQKLKGEKAPENPGSARGVSDAFQVHLSLEGGPSFSASTLGFPVGGLGPFDPLLAWLDRTLTDELRRHHPDRPVILSPDEL
jgi:hypothetical protein